MTLLTDHFNPQETSEWNAQRVGKFTSSKIYTLLAKSRKKDEVFGDTALSYIYEKTFERITGMEGDNFNGNDATEWGTGYEDEAAQEFTRITGIELTHAAFVQDRKREYLGGSVDRYALSEKAIAEIKCPYSPKNFIKAATGFIDPKYYAQNQCNMHVSNVDKCYHITYDPRMPEGSRLVYQIIKKDVEFIANLLERVDLAEEELQKLIKTIQK